MAANKNTIFGALAFLGGLTFLGAGFMRSQAYSDGSLDKITALSDPDKYQRFEDLKDKLGVKQDIDLYDLNSFSAEAHAREIFDKPGVQIGTPLDHILTAEELDAVKAHEIGHLLDTHVDSLGALSDGELQQREYNADKYAKAHGYGEALSRALIKIVEYNRKGELPPEMKAEMPLDVRVAVSIEKGMDKVFASESPSVDPKRRQTHPADSKRIAKLIGIEGLQNLIEEFPHVKMDSVELVIPTMLKGKPSSKGGRSTSD